MMFTNTFKLPDHSCLHVVLPRVCILISCKCAWMCYWICQQIH